jgi:hypothetical protein
MQSPHMSPHIIAPSAFRIIRIEPMPKFRIAAIAAKIRNLGSLRYDAQTKTGKLFSLVCIELGLTDAKTPERKDR